MNKLKIAVSTISLETQLDKLALEASFLNNLLGTFTDILPGLAVRLVDQSTMFKKGLLNTSTGELKTQYKSLSKKLPYANFANYSDTLVMVPEEFNGNLLEFVVVMNNLSTNIYKDVNSLLSEYTAMLSSFITNRDDKISLKDHTAFYRRVTHDRDQHSKRMNVYFGNHNDRSVLRLGKVVSRFKEIEDLVSAVVILERAYSNENLRTLTVNVDKAVELLTMVHQQVLNGTIVTLSGPAAENISKGTYELAKYVEFISVYRYRAQQTIQTVYTLLTKLDTLLV